MTWGEFARKWAASTRTERAASQEHFIDICRLLGEQTPNEADPNGDFYAFEKGAERTSSGDGFADVWLRGKFGWEYKGKRKNLDEAYKQLLDYHEALEQPPLLVVCDLERFEVHTKWTNTESWVYHFTLRDLAEGNVVEVRTPVGAPAKNPPSLTAPQVLKALFEDPSKLRPNRTTTEITEEAARRFEAIALELRKWKDNAGNQIVDDMRIARFISRMVFCMFATDIGLLPTETFSAILTEYELDAAGFRAAIRELWANMKSGGRFGAKPIEHFNGDLFEDDDVPDEVTAREIIALKRLDDLDWADVEPAIFGTLFERILDKDTRAKLGAHYTSREDIELLVEPVLMAPLRKRWDEVRRDVEAAVEQAKERGATAETLRERVRSRVGPFLDELASIQVLDPACGSGNFLYVSLALLKALEKEAIAFAEYQGVDFEPRVDPSQLHGIEINPYAHEVASIVIWIGYLQWKHRNGINLRREQPILRKLHQIELKDAILDQSDPKHPREAEWPKADVIVGNPPFLGGKFLRKGGKNDPGLGDTYVDDLFAVYDGRVRRESDLCCYWFDKALKQINDGKADRAGLLATQAIRGGANRDVLQRIKRDGHIFFAVDEREWVLSGATVRISMVGFDAGSGRPPVLLRHKDTVELDETIGKPVKRRVKYDRIQTEGINADLTAQADMTSAEKLRENAGISFFGVTVIGPFDIEREVADAMIATPNPGGESNREVVKRWANGSDLTGRPRDRWIIDFGNLPELDAARYERPFAYVTQHVKAQRDNNRRTHRRLNWWLHGEYAPNLRREVVSQRRFLVTPRVSKHRLFTWLPGETLPDSATVAFARSDDYFFGVLQSRPHTLWALAQGTQLESRPRYTPTTCFETFPLPWKPGSEPEDDPRYLAIAEAARELNAYREGWLNPPPVDGIPLPESELKKRTLTNLYNEPTAMLEMLTRKLDEAVFAAYRWPADLSDQEVLSRLLALNLGRAAARQVTSDQ